jgi:hypothetical protein
VQTIAAAPDPIVESEPDPIDGAGFDLSTVPEMDPEGTDLWDITPGAWTSGEDKTQGEEDYLTPDEIDLIESWKSPIQAQVWAVHSKACANEHEAQASWAKITGGKTITVNDLAHYAIQFYKRQRQKLQEKKS